MHRLVACRENDLLGFVESRHKMESDTFSNVVFEVIDVILVLFRKYQFFQAFSLAGQCFLFHTTDLHDFAIEAQFACHAKLRFDWRIGGQRYQARSYRDACRWPVFRRGAFWSVNVDVISWVILGLLLEKVDALGVQVVP